jgi:kynurenine formamidase
VSQRRLIDLSHPIENGMITYPGLPAPVISDFWSRESTRGKYSEGTTFQIGRVDMIANTGTYLDAPFHRYAEGPDVAALPLERLADILGIRIDLTARRDRAIEDEALSGLSLRGRAVLFHTGWDAHWRTPRYNEGHPYLTRSAAELLVAEQAALVGIDSLNIDATDDGSRPVHTLLLEAGIPILEHLSALHRLPKEGFRLHAVPAPVTGMGSFPVRVYAIL